MKVYIDPNSNIDYTSFYIKGLYDVFGESNINFANQYFTKLKISRALKFVVINNKIINRYIIDWSDDSAIEDSDYEWCDVYGKINLNPEYTSEKYNQKIISVAPSFGIKIWDNSLAGFYGFRNLLQTQRSFRGIKSFLSSYYKQSRQISINAYKPGKARSNYIYSINTLWSSDQWINNDNTVNQYRANFMNACKSMKEVHFEGGFVYSKIKNTNIRFQNLVVNEKWVPKQIYINKIKASTLVFNTPAWALCHGWKLGEYLALGKAIISTPLVNDLPEPLEHGKHIHIVSGKETEIREAIELIRSNEDYRKTLEKNAYEYYLRYVSPSQSIRIVLNKCENNILQSAY
ncbi:hypothetical protein GCM10028807_27920 [Spirosoma daeguense]